MCYMSYLSYSIKKVDSNVFCVIKQVIIKANIKTKDLISTRKTGRKKTTKYILIDYLIGFTFYNRQMK